ncbi:MAG: OmpA family protein [Desulfomonilaceae bacterium]
MNMAAQRILFPRIFVCRRWMLRRLSSICCSAIVLWLIGAVLLTCALGSGVAAAEDCQKAKAFYKLGVSLLNYEERRAAFQKAVDLCPSYAEAHNNLADALENLAALSQGRNFDDNGLSQGNRLLDQAVQHYTRALELKEDLYQSHIGLGEIYLGQGRYQPALEEFKKALAISPLNERADEGLKEARKKLAQETDRGFRKSEQLVARAKKPSTMSAGRVMGVENHTVRDRESFHNILFAGWSAQIAQGEPIEQVNEIGKALSSPELSAFNFVIEGHTNTVGGFEENMKLSWERARSVKSYLVKQFGIAPERLVVQGYGYTRTKVKPDNAAENRRVEVVFLEKDSGR